MPSGAGCRVDAVLKIIGDRWSLGILHALSVGPRRTLELHRAFKGLSTKTLAERLKKMERRGIVSRTSYRESPPRVEYSLTEKGIALLPVIDVIAGTAALFELDEMGTSCGACAGGALPRYSRESGVSDRLRRDRNEEPALPSPPSRKKTDVTLL